VGFTTCSRLSAAEGGPADTHSKREEPPDTGIHFIFFDQLALVSVLDALTYGVTKTSVVLKQA
jgi:hypothetical protein